MTIYLYHKRHKITGLNYFGKTKGNNPVDYLGSGLYWRHHLKCHGKEVETVQLWKFENQEECTKFALEFSRKYNIVESNEWANLCLEDGIGGGDVISQLPIEKYLELCRNRAIKIKKSWENRDKILHAKIQSNVWAKRNKLDKQNISNKISNTLKNKTEKERAEILKKRRITYSKRTSEQKVEEKEKRKVYLESRPSLICPHCGLSSKSAVNMRRYHFDKCKLSRK